MTDILHMIGQGLRYPCYAVLLVLMAVAIVEVGFLIYEACLLYTSPSPRD